MRAVVAASSDRTVIVDGVDGAELCLEFRERLRADAACNASLPRRSPALLD
jgi:hypothetical protein